jgi:hypothetical protein
MREEEIPIIILARKPLGEYWMSIAIEAMKGNQEVMIHYTDKNAGQLELFLKLLKPFGWIEKDSTRGRTTTKNTLCLYKDHNGICTNPNVQFKGKCNEAIRISCKNYEAKDPTPIRVNYIIIEQVPSIRDL